MMVRILVCILAAGFALYAYIDKQNELTELRIAIPALEKKVKQIRIDNRRLLYELDKLKSPDQLMEFAERPEFGHLKYPRQEDVIILKN